MLVDAAFFQRFDELTAKAVLLANAPAALHAAQTAVNHAQGQLQHQRKALSKNMAFAQEQRDRIDLVSSHWFFGNTALQPQTWLRGGVKGKKERAEAKLERAEGEYPALVQAIRASEAALPALQERLNGCRSAHARRAQIERELTTMRDDAVKAHPSQQLVKLQAEHASATQQASTWSQHANGLHGAVQACHGGKEHYHKATNKLEDVRKFDGLANHMQTVQTVGLFNRATGRWVRVTDHGGADSPAMGGFNQGWFWERFEIHTFHGYVGLYNPTTNRWLRVNDHGGADSPAQGWFDHGWQWERFVLRHNRDGTVGLHNPATNRWLRVTDQGGADSPAMGHWQPQWQWERFELRPVPPLRTAQDVRGQADALAREAYHEMNRGADAMTRASDMIPAGVRAHFPAQCASLASVQMPRLMREHAPGARAADERTYAAHVRSGAHAVQQQEATLRQLEGLANQEAQNARARCGRLVGQIAAEKQRLFDELRDVVAATGAPPPVTSFVEEPRAPSGGLRWPTNGFTAKLVPSSPSGRGLVPKFKLRDSGDGRTWVLWSLELGSASGAAELELEGPPENCRLRWKEQNVCLEVGMRKMEEGREICLWNDDPPVPADSHSTFALNADGSISPSRQCPGRNGGDPSRFALGLRGSKCVLVGRDDGSRLIFGWVQMLLAQASLPPPPPPPQAVNVTGAGIEFINDTWTLAGEQNGRPYWRRNGNDGDCLAFVPRMGGWTISGTPGAGDSDLYVCRGDTPFPPKSGWAPRSGGWSKRPGAVPGPAPWLDYAGY